MTESGAADECAYLSGLIFDLGRLATVGQEGKRRKRASSGIPPDAESRERR